MPNDIPSVLPVDAEAGPGDSAKRQQILAGAEDVFLKLGFDAASMDAVAKAAGVSKGTLYVYFKNKQDLFQTLILEKRRHTAERMLDCFDSDDPPEVLLSRFAHRMMEKMSDRKQIALIRTVIGAVDTFPELGRTFFAAGPQTGATRLAEYLARQVERGTIVCDDPLEAAWHFMALCLHPALTGPVYFALPHPDPEEAERHCQSAIRVFMAAYGPKRR